MVILILLIAVTSSNLLLHVPADELAEENSYVSLLQICSMDFWTLHRSHKCFVWFNFTREIKQHRITSI